MSTKSTLSYSRREESCPPYHLYEEYFVADGSVYLELDGPDIEFVVEKAGNKVNRVVVRIPCEVWNRIIQVGKRKPDPEEKE